MASDSQTTDPHAIAVEIGQLMERIRHLDADVRRHRGNVVEAWAYASKCDRHMRHMRACKWINNKPCDCRAAAAQIWPEYAT